MIFLRNYKKYITQTHYRLTNDIIYKNVVICQLYFGYRYYFDGWNEKNYILKGKYETTIRLNSDYELITFNVYRNYKNILQISGYIDYNDSLNAIQNHNNEYFPNNQNNEEDDTYAYPWVYNVKIYTKVNSTKYLHNKYQNAIRNHFVSFLLKDVKIKLDPKLFKKSIAL